MFTRTMHVCWQMGSACHAERSTVPGRLTCPFGERSSRSVRSDGGSSCQITNERPALMRLQRRDVSRRVRVLGWCDQGAQVEPPIRHNAAISFSQFSSMSAIEEFIAVYVAASSLLAPVSQKLAQVWLKHGAIVIRLGARAMSTVLVTYRADPGRLHQPLLGSGAGPATHRARNQPGGQIV